MAISGDERSGMISQLTLVITFLDSDCGWLYMYENNPVGTLAGWGSWMVDVGWDGMVSAWEIVVGLLLTIVE